MSFIKQLYSEKRKELEEEVNKNVGTESVEVRFVANKVIEQYFAMANKDDLMLSIRRLNRLVQLVDIMHRKRYAGKALFNQGYLITESGLVVVEILCGYQCLLKGEKTKEYFERSQGEYQKLAELKVGPRLNSHIDLLVSRVLKATRYVDTVDLVKMLYTDELQALRSSFVEYDDRPLPQEIVSELYQNFDFDKLEELNQREKERLGV